MSIKVKANKTTERTLEDIEREIAETKLELENVQGTETEVYARIVGYYRAVKHWNKGKRDEFDLRKNFDLDVSNAHLSGTSTEVKKETAFETKNDVVNNAKVMATEAVSETKSVTAGTKAVTYEMYTRKTCPNCPPVKEFMAELDFPGRAIDVDTAEGLAEAARKGVFASPTVIFYNEAGIETARCHNVEELEAIFDTVTVTA